MDEIPEGLTAGRVIIACPDYEGKIEAQFMLCEDQWNGVNFMDINWDGKVLTALAKHIEHLGRYSDEYKEKATPAPNWICVTVDYHS